MKQSRKRSPFRLKPTEADLRKARGDYIIGIQRAIDVLKRSIENYTKAFYPSYMWLDHKVSTFWRCEKSPVGMCIFKLGGKQHNLPTDCIFCHQPAERK